MSLGTSYSDSSREYVSFFQDIHSSLWRVDPLRVILSDVLVHSNPLNDKDGAGLAKVDERWENGGGGGSRNLFSYFECLLVNSVICV